MMRCVDDHQLVTLMKLFSRVQPGGPSITVQRFVEGSTGVEADQLVFEDGCLVGWLPGESRAAQAAVWHAGSRDANSFALGLRVGAPGLAGTCLAVREASGWRKVACPPTHLLGSPLWGSGEEIRNADLIVQVRLTATPFGDIDYWLTFERGLLAAGDVGVSEGDVHVRFEIPSRYLVDYHLGRRDLVGMLTDPDRFHIAGNWPDLALAGGLMESAWFSALWRRECPEPAAELYAGLGEVFDAEPYQQLRAMDLRGFAGEGFSLVLRAQS